MSRDAAVARRRDLESIQTVGRRVPVLKLIHSFQIAVNVFAQDWRRLHDVITMPLDQILSQDNRLIATLPDLLIY